ncbi:MAG TPA: hypothetical protein VGV13_13760 [Methylomirabilota bacterium]|jgi:hypothetical protein|nr:hypothetical protein [Methylomirabilota bacterium]
MSVASTYAAAVLAQVPVPPPGWTGGGIDASVTPTGGLLINNWGDLDGATALSLGHYIVATFGD